MSIQMSEAEYRGEIQRTFDRIEAAFADVDPDRAECEQALGAMTITLADRSRCILSSQPSVRQLWLALAAKGTAYHFNFDAAVRRWVDDKGKGIELIEFLQGFFRKEIGLDLQVKRDG
jgi:CyaY protein